MTTRRAALGLGVLGVVMLGACRPRTTRTSSTEKVTVLADIGFRPAVNGYKFQNEGGRYPKTPPVLTSQGVDKMFGGGACVGGDANHCRLTPVANEWMGSVNRAMNIGQCEGMAVSSLAFFKKVYSPSSYEKGATSVHALNHSDVSSLIGYFWAFQMVNPVRADKINSLMTQTPNSVEDQLVTMLKTGDLATIAIHSASGGHAVTPYAVEDRGGGVHWIRIYDNNWPDKERYIVIDRNENTWSYELASLNPDVPREPWSGTADTHSIAITPLSARLGRAECPFCAGGKKMVFPNGANGVALTSSDGKRVGREGGKVVNEIPGAEVIDLASYLDGAPPGEPIYVVPAEGSYEVSIEGKDNKVAPDADEDHGVAIVGNGAAVTVETPKLKPGEKDTLSVRADGSIKYRTANGGVIPTIRLAADGANGGMHARLSSMKADPNDELEIKMDHAAGQITVGGGGKRSDSYDLKVTHVQAGQDDHVVEQKGIKFKAGEMHTIQTTPAGAAKGDAFKISRGTYKPAAKGPVVPPPIAPGGKPAPASPASPGKTKRR